MMGKRETINYFSDQLNVGQIVAMQCQKWIGEKGIVVL
jgi:hypothetical protein